MIDSKAVVQAHNLFMTFKAENKNSVDISAIVDLNMQIKKGELIYAELSGDFPLGDSRQPTYKSLRPFDLVS
ncbi:hypothetical protein ACWB3A_17515 [Acinetobacter baumannii]|uniref:hypothetical protein n=1 Tax=Acinetobacter baumannii TaxID=470 RepID=UPI000F787A10|nr:hypothetical protein [Acinetobacter baumannii]MCZ3356709.1 hypothetical protein [Acinetobacter baumannii]MDK6140678.1 hypothetical protein [Acinetobacter baumannii]QEY04226.1 hypothetical protein ABCAM1_1774 [Acinetobacter baumannii]RSR86573.1 hypothetical protein EA664_16400 [Acinetobacter baumannii]